MSSKSKIREKVVQMKKPAGPVSLQRIDLTPEEFSSIAEAERVGHRIGVEEVLTARGIEPDDAWGLVVVPSPNGRQNLARLERVIPQE